MPDGFVDLMAYALGHWDPRAVSDYLSRVGTCAVLVGAYGRVHEAYSWVCHVVYISEYVS